MRIGRVEAELMTSESAAAVCACARREALACVYFLADASDAPTPRNAEDAGFRLVDTRVTLSRSLARDDASALHGVHGSASDDASIDTARDSDLPALRAIARVSHTDSRFYADPGFSRERCDALYARWIENAVAGDAARVFVARRGDQAVGYLSAHLDPADDGPVGRIGLIAVAESARGRAFGPKLVASSLAFFAGAGALRAEVVTQARNARALRLYERAGFCVDSLRPWFHLWTERATA